MQSNNQSSTPDSPKIKRNAQKENLEINDLASIECKLMKLMEKCKEDEKTSDETNYMQPGLVRTMNGSLSSRLF